MDCSNHIGFRISELGRIIRRAVNCGVEKNGIDPLVIQRGWIIGYIKHHEEQIICQRDVENLFHMPKSTATDTLQVLEKEGIIERVPLENDARRKQIVLTEKGQEFSRLTEEQIINIEKYIQTGISEEELKVFFSVLEKLKENALDYKNNYEAKEE